MPAQESGIWQEVLAVADVNTLRLRAAGETGEPERHESIVELTRAAFSAWPDGHPKKKLSTNCFALEMDGGSFFFKAQCKAEYKAWINFLSRCVLTHKENARILELEQAILAAELTRASRELAIFGSQG